MLHVTFAWGHCSLLLQPITHKFILVYLDITSLICSWQYFCNGFRFCDRYYIRFFEVLGGWDCCRFWVDLDTIRSQRFSNRNMVGFDIILTSYSASTFATQKKRPNIWFSGVGRLRLCLLFCYNVYKKCLFLIYINNITLLKNILHESAFFFSNCHIMYSKDQRCVTSTLEKTMI